MLERSSVPQQQTLPAPRGRRSSADRSDLTRELFAEYADCHDEARRKLVRDRIIEINMCVAESLAHRYRDRGERLDDLEQVAYVGLAKAVNGFDPGREKDFLTYAVPTISGELKRHFRDHCWTVRPPRRIQELQGRIAACVDTLHQDLGRSPRPRHIAGHLGVDLEDVVEALAAEGCFTPSSLDIRVGESGTAALGELIGQTDHEFGRTEIRALLGPLVSALPESDRETLALRFFSQWTQEQIAQHFGITQMQVSRRLSRIMRKLRAEIG